MSEKIKIKRNNSCEAIVVYAVHMLMMITAFQYTIDRTLRTGMHSFFFFFFITNLKILQTQFYVLKMSNTGTGVPIFILIAARA